MFKIKGLRRHWLFNTVGIICAMGMVCVMLVTAIFAMHYYSDAERALYDRAELLAEVLEYRQDLDYDGYYRFCVDYVENFEDGRNLEAQFISGEGTVVASSAARQTGQRASAEDAMDAMRRRATVPYMGEDIQLGHRVMAVSAPVIFSSGEVVGALRYTVATDALNRQILCTFAVAAAVLAVIVAVVFVSADSCIHSVLAPLADIIDKAKRITSGSYGTRITTGYKDEMGELASTINEMSMKISQNEKMQTEFISSLSHELRTPLTAITGWSETLLNSDELDRETSRGVKIIAGEAKRLTEMVKELLDFTRIQDGNMTLNIEQADIRAEFEDTVFMYGSRLAQDGIELDYLENDDEIPEVSCDPMRLRQVFLNILDNAAKHGGEGKRIQVSMCSENGSVVIRIRDFGPGIPEDELPLVKHKFYKGSSKARGTGIGLAVCDEIVRLHGGALVLENAEGGGTLVTVRIPVNG